MPVPNTLKTYKENTYINHDLNFYLDLNDARLSKEDYNDQEIPIAQALDAMKHLELGAISNPDENRQVGHYWLRNTDLAPSNEISKTIKQTLSDIKTFANSILNKEFLSPDSGPFTHLLIIGIGGSALGPQFIADALGTNRGLTIKFLDNTDPDGIDQTLNDLSPHLNQTLVVVISKSGGTAETRNGMLETQNIFAARNISFARQAVAITGEGSQLYKLAKSQEWLSIFPMWDWVGGRTSVMSAVGILPAALMGIDVEAFLNGASEMDEITRNTTLNNNPAALLALTWYVLGKGKGEKDMVILPYKDRLLLFSRYLQQLIMESLGKRFDLDGNLVNQGIAVYGNKGSTDQHAYVQQLRDGLNNFFVTFIEVLNDRQGNSILVDDENSSGDYLFGFLKGTETALRESGRHSITITIPDLSPRSIGALIALYERAVGLYASLVNINAYHQPGVEAGKKAAGNVLTIKNQVLALLAKSESALGINEISQQLKLPGEEILIYQILRHHAANHPMYIEGSFVDPENLRVNL